jgi:putative transposase
MPNYKRIWSPGGTIFFTLVTHQRRPIFLKEMARKILHQAFIYAKQKVGEFKVDAFCLLPDHLHCIWTLPENDSDYATRWKVIKASFSRTYHKQGGNSGAINSSMAQKGEVGIWQRRYWEHTIRDLYDLNQHINYIHFNPVKHGYVQSVADWPWSTFHQFVKDGFYPSDWVFDDSSNWSPKEE